MIWLGIHPTQRLISNLLTIESIAKTNTKLASSTKAPKRATTYKTTDPVIMEKTINAPAAYSKTIRKELLRIDSGTLNGDITISGNCLLASSLFTDVLATAFIMPWYLSHRIPIHPKTIGSGRLADMSALYQRYKFTKFKVNWIPEVGSQTAGAIAAWFSDNLDTVIPVSGFALRSFLTESEGAKGDHIWQPFSCPRKSTKGELDSYLIERTTGDLNTVFQSTFVSAASYYSTTATYMGDFEVEYTCKLMDTRAPAIAGLYNSSDGFSVVVPTLNKGDACSWTTNDTTAVNFWKNSPGIWYCTTSKNASSVTPYGTFNGLSGLKGDMFYMEVIYLPLAGTFTSDRVEFTFYPNSAAITANTPMLMESTTTVVFDLLFKGYYMAASQRTVQVVPIQVSVNNQNVRPNSNSPQNNNASQPLGIHIIEHESGNFDPHVVVNPFTGNVTAHLDPNYQRFRQ